MKKVVAMLLLVVIMTALAGCKTETAKDKKIKDLEFTVVEEVDQPEQLKKMIDEKKMQHMKLSYSDGEFLYVVVGYGEQKSGGFSIQVNKFYETKNAIYIDTTLICGIRSEMEVSSLNITLMCVSFLLTYFK